MMIYALLLLVSVFGASGKPFPKDELDQYMDEVLSTAEDELASKRSLPDYDYHLDYFLWGTKDRFKLKTSNTAIRGPRRLKTIGDVIGEDSGNTKLWGKLYLGTVEVEYSNLEVNILGLSYNGSAAMSMTDATVNFALNVYRDALVKCHVHVSLTQLEGEFVITLGGGSSINKLLYALAERLISKTVYQYNLLQDVLFPDITNYLGRTIQRAAMKATC